MAISTGEVTLLLTQVKGGDQDALAQLIPLVYKELRRLAGHYMRDERIGHTLQPTALVHEVYLRLIGQTHVDWHSRAHFLDDRKRDSQAAGGVAQDRQTRVGSCQALAACRAFRRRRG
jgi:hypothetical protein